MVGMPDIRKVYAPTESEEINPLSLMSSMLRGNDSNIAPQFFGPPERADPFVLFADPGWLCIPNSRAMRTGPYMAA